MGEFDLSLIREFRIRPAFYDRNSPLFKDKWYTAREWQEISNKLGYDVSLLKDRMLQLRNRYNLEKRRLEEIREKTPGKFVESQWPLFDQLHFLSEHIRARRSYKSLLPRNIREVAAPSFSTNMAHYQNPTSNDSGAWLPQSNGFATDNETSSPYANGLLTVKVEEPDSDDNDQIADGESSSTASAITTTGPQQQQQNSSEKAEAPTQDSNALLSAIKIRRLDTMQDPALRLTVKPPYKLKHNFQAGNKAPQHSQQQAVPPQSRKRPVPSNNATRPPKVEVKRPCLSASDQKYVAFGNFIAGSLLELNPVHALKLVEKFTSDVVSVLMQKNDAEAPVEMTAPTANDEQEE